MTELTKNYEEQKEALDDQRKLLTNAMKDQMMAAGAKSIKTDSGTVILGTQTRYWTEDWDAFKHFVVEHDALDLFEKRIAQRNMASFLAENPEAVPPGLNADTEYVVSVRKAT